MSEGSYLDDCGGPVNSDVSYLRDSDYLCRFNVRRGVICPVCGSGEIYQPMQAMDMPMLLRCLRCGTMQPSSDFGIE